jgi:hypothetical protein
MNGEPSIKAMHILDAAVQTVAVPGSQGVASVEVVRRRGPPHEKDFMKAFRRLVASLAIPALLVPGISAAQSDDAWKFEASIYLLLADIGGDVTFPPTGASKEVNVGVDEVLENLEFGFMGTFEARRGRWGVFNDLGYMALGNTQAASKALSIGQGGIPADVNANLIFDLDMLVWSLTGTYALTVDQGHTLDALAGTRLLDVRASVDYTLSGNVGPIAPPDRSGVREVREQNWDAIVGVKGRAGLGADGKWFVPYYFDIGTGESELTYQAMAGIGYRFGWGDAVASWRYLAYEMKSGNVIEQLDMNGPQIAAVFRW